MRLMGFNFEKICVERLKDKVENLKMNMNIDILDIKEVKTDFLKNKEDIVQINFLYSVKYEPDFANVDLKGNMIIALDEVPAKEVFKEWKKKKMPDDFRTAIFNVILSKATIKALQLEDEVNLPLHAPLPSISPNKEKEK